MITIFLETGSKTTSEYVFIKTLIKHLGVEEKVSEIVCVNGKDNLANSSNAFLANTLEGGTNLIIFDADSPANKGGFAIREKDLRQQFDFLGIKADLFLFPNNADDGDFEVLLESILRRDIHQRFFDCFEDYEKCLGGNYIAPNRKGKLFTYISAQKELTHKQRSDLGKGEWLFDDERFWDLDSPSLQPLKQFILDHCKE